MKGQDLDFLRFQRFFEDFWRTPGVVPAGTRTQVSSKAGKRFLTRPLTRLVRKSDLLSHAMLEASLLPGQYLTSRGTINKPKRLVYCTPGFKVLRANLKCWNERSRTPPTSANPRKQPLRLRGTVSSDVTPELRSPSSHTGYGNRRRASVVLI